MSRGFGGVQPPRDLSARGASGPQEYVQHSADDRRIVVQERGDADGGSTINAGLQSRAALDA